MNKIFYTFFNLKGSFKNKLIFILSALVLLIISLSIKLNPNDAFNILGTVTIPFQLVSDLLRAIATSGEVGNVFGLILFILVSFSPLIVTLIRKKTKTPFKIAFHIILSLLIGITLYLFINPSLLPNPADSLSNQINHEINQQNNPNNGFFQSYEDVIKSLNQDQSKVNVDVPEEFITQYNTIMKISLVFVIIIFVLLYLTNLFYNHTKNKKLNFASGANGLLVILKLSYLFVFFIAFFILPLMLRTNINQIDLNKIDADIVRNLYIIKFLFIYSLLLIVYFIYKKLHDLLINFKDNLIFDDTNVKLLHKTSSYFILILLISLLYQLINIIYQLINAEKIQNFNANLSLPVTQFILALAFYLMSLYMKQAYKIYKENKLTI